MIMDVALLIFAALSSLAPTRKLEPDLFADIGPRFVTIGPVGDRNLDGIDDVVVGASNEGNCSMCSGIFIIQVDADGVPHDLLARLRTAALWPVEVVDLDGDGLDEVIAIDTRFELVIDGLSHAEDPSVTSIFSFDGERFAEEHGHAVMVGEHGEALEAFRIAEAARDPSQLARQAIRLGVISAARSRETAVPDRKDGVLESAPTTDHSVGMTLDMSLEPRRECDVSCRNCWLR